MILLILFLLSWMKNIIIESCSMGSWGGDFLGVFIESGRSSSSNSSWVSIFSGILFIRASSYLLIKKKNMWILSIIGRRWAKRFLLFTPNVHGGHFMVKENGKWHFTTMFMVLLLVETTDIILRLIDSAIFSITQDTFIVFTSNIFCGDGFACTFLPC